VVKLNCGKKPVKCGQNSIAAVNQYSSGIKILKINEISNNLISVLS